MLWRFAFGASRRCDHFTPLPSSDRRRCCAQKMDVNLKNSLGMPLVWFSVVFMQRGDQGVMLRYLQQRGADIKSKNDVGQSVLFMVVSSRGREAIPTLRQAVPGAGGGRARGPECAGEERDGSCTLLGVP